MPEPTTMTDQLGRYAGAYLQVFGSPALVIDRGEGPYVWDTDGRRYLDLLGGIAVNALGHGHPALVSAVSKQVAEAVHVSNFFTTVAQIEAAERLLTIADAPAGSAVFFANSGSEAVEAAIKLTRRTGRSGIVAVAGAFHGRTMGAVSLTAKAAYREPFAPLLPGVEHVPFGDIDALRGLVDETTAAIFLEPIQGEGGVVPATTEYLRAVRELADEVGALLVLDEIQTGIGRTGHWFAWQASGVRPDAMTVAKGLGGGVPIGALVTYGSDVTELLGAGQHGSTFGGNPLACSAALAVLDTIEGEGLLANAVARGEQLVAEVDALGDDRVVEVRGAGLLRGIVLRDEVAAAAVTAAREAGFIVNAVAPAVLRLAPPLNLTAEQLSSFVSALPAILEAATEAHP